MLHFPWALNIIIGGPGAWSQHLLAQRDLHLRGFGFTLKAGAGAAEDWKAQAKDEWYADLYEHPNWNALWGADGTGQQNTAQHSPTKELIRRLVDFCNPFSSEFEKYVKIAIV